MIKREINWGNIIVQSNIFADSLPNETSAHVNIVFSHLYTIIGRICHRGSNDHKTTQEILNYRNPQYAEVGFNHPNKLTKIIHECYNNPR